MRMFKFLSFCLFALNIQASLILSNGLTNEIKENLNTDLKILNHMHFESSSDPQTLKILDINNLDSRLLEDWLFLRVNYIVEDNIFSKFNLLFKKSLFVSRENVQYPIYDSNDLLINSHHAFLNFSKDNSSSSSTIMTNIGADLYQEGKQKNQLLGIKINKQKIEVNSPRVGIVKIGEGLFSDDFLINTLNKKAKANSFARLATLFHEARHSDGHGKNLGFGHSICPKNHNYEGVLACDESLNGAYSVEKQMLIEFIKACENKMCNESETEVLRVKLIDISSRIQRKGSSASPTQFKDPSPEGLN